MAKLKKTAEVKVELNIQDSAKLFQSYMKEKKELEKKADEQKKKLIEFAKENETAFEENQLKFDCGVYIEKRVSLKTEHDDIDFGWIDKVIDADFDHILNIEIDAKEVQEHKLDKMNAKRLAKLLDEIHFKTVEKETLAVYC